MLVCLSVCLFVCVLDGVSFSFHRKTYYLLTTLLTHPLSWYMLFFLSSADIAYILAFGKKGGKIC